MLQAVRQIRVGDERAAEADQIRPAFGQRFFSAFTRVFARVNQRAAENQAQRLFERRRHHRSVIPVRFGDVNVSGADIVQHAGRRQIGGFRGIVLRAHQGGQRRQTHAQFLFADGVRHRLRHFPQETQAILQ